VCRKGALRFVACLFWAAATNFLVLSPDPIMLNQNASPNTLTHTQGDEFGSHAQKVTMATRLASFHWSGFRRIADKSRRTGLSYPDSQTLVLRTYAASLAGLAPRHRFVPLPNRRISVRAG